MTEHGRHGASPRARAVRRAHRYLPVLVVTLVIGIVGSLFVLSYSAALGRPTPRNVPVGLVAATVDGVSVENVVQHATGTTFRVESYPTRARAEAAIARQSIYGAIVLDRTGTSQLLISSASSNSVASMLEESRPELERALDASLVTKDLHPLNADDSSGLIMFYLALATIILGFVGAMQVRINAPDLRLGEDLLADVFRSAVVSLFFAIAVLFVARFETTPFLALWGMLTLAMLVSSTTLSVFRLVLGPRWGLLPTWILFVIVANPSSGGAAAPQLLPPLYAAIGRFLPTGALVQAIRDVTYFPQDLHVEPYLVLGAWTVASVGVFVALRLRQGQRRSGHEHSSE